MKLMKIAYCIAHWDDLRQLIVDKKDQTVLVNVDHIASVAPNAVTGREPTSHGVVLIDLHYVQTTVPADRSLNGTDYANYYVTEETYKKILENIEVC